MKWVISSLFALGVTAYIFFIPNFLFIRTVLVTGGSQELQTQVQGQVQNYVAHNRINLLPQKNLLFFKPEPLREFLLATNPSVYQVKKIDKKYWHTVEVEIVPRSPTYLLQSPRGTFIVSNDGVVLSAVNGPLDAAGFLVVTTNSPEEVMLGKPYFSEPLLQILAVIPEQVAEKISLRVHSVELVSVYVGPSSTQMLPSRDIIVYTEKDPQGVYAPFKIILDIQSNIAETFERLQLLLSQQSPDRLKNLSYIDMRFKQKGFICLENAPCARESLITLPITPPPPPTQSESLTSPVPTN